MKKLLFVSLALAFVLAMFVPQAMAKGEKVEICHVTDYSDVTQNEYTMVVGHWISVSVNALPAHLAHGDFEFNPEAEPGNDIDDGPIIFGLTWSQIAANLGLSLAGADCAGFVIDF